MTLPLYTPTLNFISTSSLHSLPTSPLYILSIVGYYHGTPQSPLGSPPVRRHPILYDYPHLTLPLYTPMSNFSLHLYLLSTLLFYIPSLHTQHCQLTSPPLTLPLYTLTLNFISTSSLHPLSTPPFYIPSLHTQHCRILSWYSSIAAGLPTGQKATYPV